ncbi:hypothetical protein [Hymenobacter sp. DG01]|uniref:hypothetical protein n=1 Tax=Hymenobacter sp. DG01 TaxID=2584940 RepID=UPI00111FF5A5|nr:hypothetical protein [Hymenobacter sp. DG01]
MNQSSLSRVTPPSLVSRCSTLALRVRQWMHTRPASSSFTPDYATLRPRSARPYPAHLRGPRQRRSFRRRILRDLSAAALIVAGIAVFAFAVGSCLPL